MEYLGNDLEEFAASAGTLLILYEIDHLPAAIQLYGPAELAAHVHNCSNRGKQMTDPRCMA